MPLKISMVCLSSRRMSEMDHRTNEKFDNVHSRINIDSVTFCVKPLSIQIIPYYACMHIYIYSYIYTVLYCYFFASLSFRSQIRRPSPDGVVGLHMCTYIYILLTVVIVTHEMLLQAGHPLRS